MVVRWRVEAGDDGGVLMGGAVVAAAEMVMVLAGAWPESGRNMVGRRGGMFDLAVYDFDWLFDEMKLDVE
nr:hypothetical protein [Tanacetum cinerariifolium]